MPATLYPAPHGPLAYTADKPGARGTHSAKRTIRSHAPNPSTGLLHPSKTGSSLLPHQQQNDFHFVNLTNPLTHFKPDPGDPWVGITPPPNHSTHHALPIHSKHTQTHWPHSLIIHMLQLINTHTAELCHPLTKSPN